GAIVWRDLRVIEESLLDLAERHRDSLVAGRTHGQPGAPTTFGWKVASWADEVRRHLDRLREGAPRWLVAQLGGGLGTMVDFGSNPLAVRRRPRSRRSGHPMAQLPRPVRRVQPVAHHGLRHACPNRWRGIRTAASRDRRVGRA